VPLVDALPGPDLHEAYELLAQLFPLCAVVRHRFWRERHPHLVQDYFHPVAHLVPLLRHDRHFPGFRYEQLP